MNKFFSIFINIFGISLSFFAIVKIVEFFYSRDTTSMDPIFTWLSSANLNLIAGIVELMVVGIILTSNKMKIKYLYLTWLISMFTIYRIGLNFYALSGECSCAGRIFFTKHITILTNLSSFLLILMWIVCISYLLTLKYKKCKFYDNK